MVLDRETAPANRGGAWYSEERWGRFAPLTGVLAVLLWVLGVVILESAADTPDDNAPARQWVAYYDEGSGGIVGGGFIFMLGAAVFVWFLGALRERLSGTGESGRLISTVIATGVLVAAMGMAFVAPEVAAGFAAGELDVALEPAAAQALGIVGDGFFIAGEAATAVFFLALAVAIFRTAALPSWLAWAALVFGIAALLPWIGWAIFIWGLPLFVLVTSIWMYMRPHGRTVARGAPPPAGAA